ncbi:MAG: hypothetical protein V1806_13235 [Pseudomonadota bacterium]
MHLLIYFPARHQAGQTYGPLLGDVSAYGDSEFCDTLESLASNLGAPTQEGTVVVLVPESAQQMDDILSLRNLLGDRPVTVVLPSHDPCLVGRAHLLRPRFLTYQDQEPGVLLQVLANIARKHWPCQEQHLLLDNGRSLSSGGRR